MFSLQLENKTENEVMIIFVKIDTITKHSILPSRGKFVLDQCTALSVTTQQTSAWYKTITKNSENLEVELINKLAYARKWLEFKEITHFPKRVATILMPYVILSGSYHFNRNNNLVWTKPLVLLVQDEIQIDLIVVFILPSWLDHSYAQIVEPHYW